MTFKSTVKFGVHRYESSDGRVIIYKQSRKRRLRRVVYGRRFAIDRFYTVTIDKRPLCDSGTSVPYEFRLLRDAKAAAAEDA